MFCGKCGTRCEDGDMFCPNCGVQLAAAPAAGFSNDMGAAFDSVREEAGEVYMEARSAVTGEALNTANNYGGAGYRVDNSQSSGAAVASLVLGILAIVGSFFGIWFSIISVIMGLIGVILGAKARKQAQTGVATAGFICSIIGLIFGAIGMVCAIACVGAIGGLGAGLI